MSKNSNYCIVEAVASGRKKFYQFLVLGVLILGLATSLEILQNNQETRERAAEEPSFTFAVIGDTHAGKDSKDPERFREEAEIADFNHTEAIYEIMRDKPDFYLHLGDMVEKSNDIAWNRFFEIERPLINQANIYPTLGNHEQYHLNHKYYYRFRNLEHLSSLLRENKLYYSFIQGTAQFFCLRIDYSEALASPENPGARCLPSSNQYQWLENGLKNSHQPWKIVFFHVSIYSSISDLAPVRQQMREYLHRLFKKYDVDLVIMGHNHLYERVEADDVIYITAGGGSIITSTTAPRIEGSKRLAYRNHVLLVEFDKNELKGTVIATRAKTGNQIKPGGQILDTFLLTQGVQPTSTPTLIPTNTPTPSPEPLIGDVDGDGKVDEIDYAAIIAHFGEIGSNLIGDVNGDGKVNEIDYAAVITHFGEG